jgi:hypothetical protein
MVKLTRKQIRESLSKQPIERVLLGNKGKRTKLTTKQRNFAHNVAKGLTQADAYREAYDTKGTPKTIGNDAHRLATRPDISAEIDAFRVAIEASELHKPAQIRALVIHQLTQHALSADVPPAQRIKSLELLGKVAEVGAFVDRKETKVIHESSKIKERILTKLKDYVDVNDKSATGLLEELRARVKAEPEDPTRGAPPEMGVHVTESYTHTIPLKQSDENSSPVNVAGDISENEEGEGVQNSDVDWEEEDRKDPPVTNWVEKG